MYLSGKGASVRPPPYPTGNGVAGGRIGNGLAQGARATVAQIGDGDGCSADYSPRRQDHHQHGEKERNGVSEPMSGGTRWVAREAIPAVRSTVTVDRLS